MFSRARVPRLRTQHRRLLVEELELRTLLAFDPSPLEQELLLYVNRMRTDPQGEYDRLIARTNPLEARDPATNSAVQFFDVDGNLLRSQWNTLTPVAPLAWNEALYNAAHSHNAAMIAARTQAHQVPGEPGVGQRLSNAGYPWNGYGENIYAYASSPLMAHGGFAIDWGDGPGGIQNPPGHRQNIMQASHREAGIAIDLFTNPGVQFGPLVVTQDFASRSGIGNPFVVGGVWSDANQSGWYEAGEGIGGAAIEFTKAGSPLVRATSLSAGGYQAQLSAGTWNARAIGPFGTISAGTVVVGSSNRMVNFIAPPLNGPTIVPIADQTLAEDGTLHVPLTIGDADTPLANLVVTAVSNNGTLLTAGSLAISGSGGDRTLTIAPAANQYGAAVVTISVSDGSVTSTGAFNVTVTPVNDAPTISAVSDLVLAEDTITSVLVTVGDAEQSLSELSISITTSNEALLGSASLHLAGAGATRNLSIEPAANASGTAIVTITIGDGAVTTTEVFQVTVNAVNDPPTISPIVDLFVFRNGDSQTTFLIGDVETPIEQLALTITSSNVALIPPAGFILAGFGTTRLLKVVPARDQEGLAAVTVRVSDGQIETTRTVNVRVSTDPYPWINKSLRWDVDGDSFVSAIDAVLIINLLNAKAGGSLPWREPTTATAPYYDVSPDNFVAPDDAVQVINYLNGVRFPSPFALAIAAEAESQDSAAVPVQVTALPEENVHRAASPRSAAELAWELLAEPMAPDANARRRLRAALPEPQLKRAEPLSPQTIAAVDAVYSPGHLDAILGRHSAASLAPNLR